eukprot:411407-Pyramimonas_sp.AAC.1
MLGDEIPHAATPAAPPTAPRAQPVEPSPRAVRSRRGGRIRARQIPRRTSSPREASEEPLRE